jgi:hypothetical protein
MSRWGIMPRVENVRGGGKIRTADRSLRQLRGTRWQCRPAAVDDPNSLRPDSAPRELGVQTGESGDLADRNRAVPVAGYCECGSRS